MSHRKHSFQGHEFHYSKLENIPLDLKFAYELSIGDGIQNHYDGLIQNNTLASYGHLYFGSSDYAKIFVDNCIKFSRT